MKPKKHEIDDDPVVAGLFVVTVNPGEEVLEAVQRAITDRGIGGASITLIGAVDTARISVMGLHTPRIDVERSYDAPAELTGAGEVIAGRAHLHVVLAMEDQTVAGHLLYAEVVDHFVRAYVTPVADA